MRSIFAILCLLATATAAMADPTVDTSTIRDFFIAHKDAPVITQTMNQRQIGVITSIGQDHFCSKPANAPDTAGWCINFSKIVYFKFDGHSLIFSFQTAY